MQSAAGEPSCVHHTFCHAKSLAALIDAGFTAPARRIAFPWETDGTVSVPPVRVVQVRCGAWYASVSGYDFPIRSDLYCSGGTLTLLHHRAAGPVFAAAMPDYRLVEPTNMQFPLHADAECPAVELTRTAGTSVFRSSLDRAVSVTADGFTVTADGHLTDRDGQTDSAYRLTYEFTPDAVRITAWCAADCTVRLPLIAAPSERVTCAPTQITAAAPGFTRRLTGAVPLIPALSDPADRTFHPVAGLTHFPVTAQLRGGELATFTIQIDEN